MGLPAGTTIALSPARRLIGDMMHASRGVPLVAVERTCHLGELVAARQAVSVRPSWFAIFLKAYAAVARRREQLRRSFLSFPWKRLHQHNCSVAALAIARRVGDEECVLPLLLRNPDEKSLAEIDAIIRRARTESPEKIADFRRLLQVCRWPDLARRFLWWLALNVAGKWRAQYAGTFGVSGVAALGSSLLNVICPLTTTLTYGVFDSKGTLPVRVMFDHRVLDGAYLAQTLEELEQTLRGPILAELRGMKKLAA
jgi:pyruvate/2-oxoglutarate dehydrogenase complex dihydrolipoamide acyltransferase (E2) component